MISTLRTPARRAQSVCHDTRAAYIMHFISTLQYDFHFITFSSYWMTQYFSFRIRSFYFSLFSNTPYIFSLFSRLLDTSRTLIIYFHNWASGPLSLIAWWLISLSFIFAITYCRFDIEFIFIFTLISLLISLQYFDGLMIFSFHFVLCIIFSIYCRLRFIRAAWLRPIASLSPRQSPILYASYLLSLLSFFRTSLSS